MKPSALPQFARCLSTHREQCKRASETVGKFAAWGKRLADMHVPAAADDASVLRGRGRTSSNYAALLHHVSAAASAMRSSNQYTMLRNQGDVLRSYFRKRIGHGGVGAGTAFSDAPAVEASTAAGFGRWAAGSGARCAHSRARVRARAAIGRMRAGKQILSVRGRAAMARLAAGAGIVAGSMEGLRSTVGWRSITPEQCGAACDELLQSVVQTPFKSYWREGLYTIEMMPGGSNEQSGRVAGSAGAQWSKPASAGSASSSSAASVATGGQSQTDDDDRPVLVLMHGYGSGSGMWMFNLDELSKRFKVGLSRIGHAV